MANTHQRTNQIKIVIYSLSLHALVYYYYLLNVFFFLRFVRVFVYNTVARTFHQYSNISNNTSFISHRKSLFLCGEVDEARKNSNGKKKYENKNKELYVFFHTHSLTLSLCQSLLIASIRSLRLETLIFQMKFLQKIFGDGAHIVDPNRFSFRFVGAVGTVQSMNTEIRSIKCAPFVCYFARC